MVSPSCPGTQINKLVLGLTCTTLGCEQKYNNQTTTCISRWATTMPFNVSEFLNSSDLTGQSTYSKIEYIGSVQPACNVTTFPQEPALRELISTIINVTKIVSAFVKIHDRFF